MLYVVAPFLVSIAMALVSLTIEWLLYLWEVGMAALPLWARVLILFIIAVATAKGCSYVGNHHDARSRPQERPALFRPKVEPAPSCPCPAPSCTKPHRVLPNLRPHPKEEVVDGPQPMTEDEFRRFLEDVKRHRVPPVAPSDPEPTPEPTAPITTTGAAPVSATSVVTVTSAGSSRCSTCPGGRCQPPSRGVWRRR